ncbi:MAG: DUF455 domain-containing protein [Nitratiruptor sp.]|nr:DUF455 domain-containing protein [Nitratiruptor sp.]NPA83268.1 ferritin-like domain-containing protein [Campylobacterota bacterium]
MEFFTTLWSIIQRGDPWEKLTHFSRFYTKLQRGDVAFVPEAPINRLEHPSYAAVCSIVPPNRLPRRGSLGSTLGRARLLHAIAHIEYSAIDLALDSAYRFRYLPWDYYMDWIEVAQDECRHFVMVHRLLEGLGYRYGDFPVHQGLFDAAKATQESLLERMAVVPRYLEANGLDANPKIMAKIQNFSDPQAREMLNALETILHEEIDHVAKGDRWFRWACEREGVEDPVGKYIAIVEKIYPGTLHSKQYLNIAARRAAGFSCKEIELLASKEVECDDGDSRRRV